MSFCCCMKKRENPNEPEVTLRHPSGTSGNSDSVGGGSLRSSKRYNEADERNTSIDRQTEGRGTLRRSSSNRANTSDVDVTETSFYRQGDVRHTSRRTSRRKAPNKPYPTLFRQGVKYQPIVVAAIDIGTTFCTWAFGFVHDCEKDPSKLYSGSWKNGQAPTCLLLKKDESEYRFGYEAEDKYKRMPKNELNDWLYFHRFKMSLYGEKQIDERSELADINGNKISALKVFYRCIEYMKDDLLTDLGTRRVDAIKDEDILWVLTVPAIWNDAAKRFMRKAAEMAEIDGQRLVISLEPEAASVYCRRQITETSDDTGAGHPIELQPGSSYLVLDAGGGTIDIAVHRILEDDKVEEVYQSSGGPWGGNTVNQKFVELLCEIFGSEAMENLKKEHVEDHTDLMNEFEAKKKEAYSQNEQETIKIPIELQNAKNKDIDETNGIRIIGDKLRISKDRVKGLFKETITNICDHLAELFKNDSVKQCKVIMMVGGFSDCKLLQNAVEETVPSVKILKPKDAGRAIVKGAVLYGYNPTVVSQRICKYTYGEGLSHVKTKSCDHPETVTMEHEGRTHCQNIFAIHATKGTRIKFGEYTKEVSGGSLEDSDYVLIMLFASPKEHPYLVTEEGCFAIGKFKVPVSNGNQSEVGVRLMFGGTEIKVIAVDKDTGLETTHSLQYL